MSRGPGAARTQSAGQSIGGGSVGKAHPDKSGARKTARASQGRQGDPGTGTTDLRSVRARPQARGDREGGQGLAVDRPACYHRRAKRRRQDGAIDARGTQADRHALELERARFRRQDRRCHLIFRAERRIEASLGVSPVRPPATSALRQNKQKHVFSQLTLPFRYKPSMATDIMDVRSFFVCPQLTRT